MTRWQPIAVGCLLWLSPCAWAGVDHVGVLVLAHGGSPEWNRAVEEAVEQTEVAHPHTVAFGMGMHPEEVVRLAQAIETLQGQGVERLVVVPLAVSASSDVMRQWQYLLGLRQTGPWMDGIRPVVVGVPLKMTGALEDGQAVVEVLLERSRALSRSPAQETVVLVAHGPVSDDDDARWLDMMGRLAAQLKAAAGFREVTAATLRDDAPEVVVEAAARRLRQLVEEHGRDGPVLVVPLLVARGGIEQRIPQRLEGLQYVFDGAALLPHPAMSRWIARQLDEALHP